MKKGLRIFLFTALLLCLVGVTALCAAAAGEYEVRNGSNAVVGTYDTLSSAVSAVAGNNYTINVLGDVTEAAATTLNKNYTYTINGNGHTIANTIESTMLSVSSGTVTLRDVTIARQNQAGTIINISSTPNVTLDSVTITGGYIQMYLSGAGRLTVQGASSLGTGCGDRIMHITNASRGGRVTLAGGTYVDGPAYGFTGSGAEIVVTGGTFTASNAAMFELLDNDYISPIIISGGDFTATGSAKIIYIYRTGNELGTTSNLYAYGDDVVRISGGTFHINGASSHAVYTCVTVPLDTRNDGAITGHPTVTISGGTFIGAEGAHALLYGTSTTITTGLPYYNVTGGNFSGSMAWIRSAGSEVFQIGTPGNNETPYFYGNTGAADARFIRFHNASQNGSMIIYGGRFVVESENTLFNAAGADIDIRGGSFTHAGRGFYMEDGDRVSNVTVSGGTFNNVGSSATFAFTAADNVNNPKKGSLEISGGTFNSVNGATIVLYSTGEIGTHCTISGGTFNGGGSTGVLLIEGHNDVLSPLFVTGGKFSEDITRYVLGHGSSGVSVTIEGGVTYYTVNAAEIRPFCGSQVALGQNLSLYLYFAVPNATAAQNPTLAITVDGVLTELDECVKSNAYPDGARLADGYTLLRFTYAGIAPQRMGDVMTAVLKVNGAAYATMGEYSVTGYCGKLLSGASYGAETKRLVANLLNYGAAAQAYTGYHTAELVNTVEGVNTYATAFENLSAPAAAFSGPGANGYALTRCGLRFDSVNRLYVRLTAPVLSAVRVTYTIGGNTMLAVMRDAGDGTYIAYTEGLNLTDFGKTVVFTMQDADAGDGINVMPVTCTYSVLSFITAWQSDDGVTGDLAKALGSYYQSADTYLTPFTPVLRFVAISDIHFMTWDDSSTTTTVMPTQESDLIRCKTRLTSLFTRTYEYAATQSYTAVDAFMLVGDNTDDGTEKQITDLLSIVYDNINSEQTRLLIVNGNHEFYDTGESGGSSTQHVKADNRLLDLVEESGITNYNALKFHTTVGGYHFIGFSPTCNGGRAFDDATMEWLDGEIAAAIAENTAAGRPNDPVFVCQHQQPYNTVNGSSTSLGGNDQANVREIMNKYPQVVDFAGHSHTYIDHPRSVWQGEFTALSTGTLSYSSGATNTRGGTRVGNHGDPYNEYNEKENGEFTIVELDANNRMRLVYFQLDEGDYTTPVKLGERIINVGDKTKFNWGALQRSSWSLPYFTEDAELTPYEISTPTSLQVNIP